MTAIARTVVLALDSVLEAADEADIRAVDEGLL